MSKKAVWVFLESDQIDQLRAEYGPRGLSHAVRQAVSNFLGYREIQGSTEPEEHSPEKVLLGLKEYENSVNNAEAEETAKKRHMLFESALASYRAAFESYSEWHKNLSQEKRDQAIRIRQEAERMGFTTDSGWHIAYIFMTKKDYGHSLVSREIDGVEVE